MAAATAPASAWRRAALAALAAVLLALALLSASVPAARAAEEEEVETISPEDLIEEREQAALAEAEQSLKEEDDEDAGPFDAVGELGADLACSACELTVDTLVRDYFSQESAARAEAKKKAEDAEKEKAEKVEAEKDASGDGKDGEGSSGDDEAEEEKKGEEDATDKKQKKDKKSKKKSKKQKGKKKTPAVKVDAKKVASDVVEGACKPVQFFGASVIGTYPGRRYSTFADSFSSGKRGKKGLSLDSLNAAGSENAELGKACKSFVAGQETWLAAKLAQSSARKGKGLKKLKRDLCERRNRMCKSAALGFEAESACLARALRAVTAGEFEKAARLSGNCPTSQSA